ncbi:Uncharacterised protein [Mycobacteroides abscessus subsp. massiliense]|nr:Uncharacterised protein [Mycobacteroides abscessus subsp. massiliense]
MDAVHPQRFGDLGAIERTHVLAGDRAPEPGQQPAVGHRVISGLAVEAPDGGGGESLLHEFVIEQFLGCGRQWGERGEPGLVRQQLSDGDRLLAVGRELWPVPGHGSVVGQEPAVGQPMNDGGGYALGCRVDDGRGVVGPGHARTRLAGPDIEHRFAVHIHAECAAADAAHVHRRELANHPIELGLGPAVHPAGQLGADGEG